MLSERQDDGATTRDHLESIWRQSGEMPPELEEVPCPDCMRYLWGYFVSMSLRRTGNGYSANAISNAEMLAWALPRGIVLSPFELDALDGLESVYLQRQAKEAANKAKRK